MFNNNNYYDPYGQNPNQVNWNNTVIPPSSRFNTISQNTNILRVPSLDEAIMKTNARGSEMVYFHQTKDEFYVVRVDVTILKTMKTIETLATVIT